MWDLTTWDVKKWVDPNPDDEGEPKQTTEAASDANVLAPEASPSDSLTILIPILLVLLLIVSCATIYYFCCRQDAEKTKNTQVVSKKEDEEFTYRPEEPAFYQSKTYSDLGVYDMPSIDGNIPIDKLFEELAIGLKKPANHYSKFAAQLQNDEILDLKTLATLNADEIDALKFPLGVKKNVNEKISAYKIRQIELKQIAGTETPYIHMEALIIYQRFYELLASVHGANWTNIDQAERDAEDAKCIAKALGIAETNINAYTNLTVKEFQSTFRNLVTKFQRITANGGRVFLFFYTSGHGAINPHQCLIANTDDPNRQLLEVEQKLRNLAHECNTNVLSVYDACTVVNKKFKGEDDQPMPMVGEKYIYTSLGINPASKVALNSVFTRSVAHILIKKA